MEKLESKLFTESEYLKIIEMAIRGEPQTKEQLVHVVKEAEEMCINSELLRHILKGNICMCEDANGNIRLKLPHQ